MIDLPLIDNSMLIVDYFQFLTIWRCKEGVGGSCRGGGSSFPTTLSFEMVMETRDRGGWVDEPGRLVLEE